MSTDEVSDRLAQIPTVSRADAYAVLKEPGGDGGNFFHLRIKPFRGNGIQSPV